MLFRSLKRQKEGLEAARRRGDVQIGRPRARIPFEFWDVYLLWKSGTVKTKELVSYSKNNYGICKRTFYRRIRELDSQFGDYPLEELRAMDVSNYQSGFLYLTEDEEATRGYYNPYRNNPDKENASARKRKELRAAQLLEATTNDDAELRRIIREKRQTEFAQKFQTTVPKPVTRGKVPTLPPNLDDMQITTIIK